MHCAVTYLDVEVSGTYPDLHSGNFGGAVQNTLRVLARLHGAMIIDMHCHGGKGDGLTGPWDTDASLHDYLPDVAANARADAAREARARPHRRHVAPLLTANSPRRSA